MIDSGGFAPAPPELKADGVMRMIFGLRGFFGYQVVPSGEVFWFQNGLRLPSGLARAGCLGALVRLQRPRGSACRSVR
jgi:hypothetical protein